MSLKRHLERGEALYGLWLGLANSYSAEVCAGSGADWVLVDGEHAPNTLTTVLAQLQAVQHRVAVVVRVPDQSPTGIKAHLDIGAHNLLVPMVESAEQAEAVVAATRYPPLGNRGVASTLNRAGDFGRRADYLRTAADDICVLVQIESEAGLTALPEIAAVRGVDGLFIGPADLAASMGHIGNPRHPEVRRAVEGALEQAHAAGVPVGLYASSPADGRDWVTRGAVLVAVGSDVGVLQRGTAQLFREARGTAVGHPR